MNGWQKIELWKQIQTRIEKKFKSQEKFEAWAWKNIKKRKVEKQAKKRKSLKR